MLIEEVNESLFCQYANNSSDQYSYMREELSNKKSKSQQAQKITDALQEVFTNSYKLYQESMERSLKELKAIAKFDEQSIDVYKNTASIIKDFWKMPAFNLKEVI